MKKILVPTDFSEDAQPAVRAAVDMARRLGASVTLLHVYHPWGDFFDPPGFRERMRPTLFEKLEELLKSLEVEGIEVHTAVEEGRAAATLVAFAGRWGHDLIVLGSHGAGRAPRVSPGSTTERVVRTSTAPVLVVPGTWSAAMRGSSDERRTEWAVGQRILVAHDLSEPASRALESVRELRSQLHCAVDVLHVLPVPDVTHMPAESFAPVPPPPEAHVEDAQRKLQRSVDQTFGPDAQAVGVHVERRGEPGHTIVEKATELGADLVCVATTGKSGVERMLLGSTSIYVVRHSPVPVLATH